MPEENTTSGEQAGVAHVTTSASTEAVGSVASTGSTADAISLSELNTLLGKTFPNKETALKSIVDTNSYVGRKKEDIEKEVLAKVSNTEETNKLSKQIEDMRKDMFYKDNPQYATPEIKAMIEGLGGNPSEVVSKPEFKGIFDKVKGYDEVQNQRTVLDSNPRLATSRDALTKATDSLSKGARLESVENDVANAVLALLG